MNVVCEALDTVRKSRGVCLLTPAFVSRKCLPAIIEIDINIPCFGETSVDNSLRSRLYETLVDIGFESVPGVPSYIMIISACTLASIWCTPNSPICGFAGLTAAKQGAAMRTSDQSMVNLTVHERRTHT